MLWLPRIQPGGWWWRRLSADDAWEAMQISINGTCFPVVNIFFNPPPMRTSSIRSLSLVARTDINHSPKDHPSIDEPTEQCIVPNKETIKRPILFDPQIFHVLVQRFLFYIYLFNKTGRQTTTSTTHPQYTAMSIDVGALISIEMHKMVYQESFSFWAVTDGWKMSWNEKILLFISHWHSRR